MQNYFIFLLDKVKCKGGGKVRELVRGVLFLLTNCVIFTKWIY